MLTKENFQPNPYFVVTGRQQSWLNQENKVLPVSCTMISVADSYHEVNYDKYGYPEFNKLQTIAGSWDFVSHAIKTSCGVAVDLSKIRSKGTIGSGGMVAQGVTNWMHYYSDINEDTVRGSVFKNGAVVLFLDYSHPDLIDFLNYPIERTKWAKRAVYVDDQLFNPENEEKLKLIIQYLDQGTIFVSKKSYDNDGERLFSQVCVEILVKSQQTCSLGHVNLGLIKDFSLIPKAFSDSMVDLINLWKLAKSEIQKSDYYGDPDDDPQVGLGIIGLANLLCNHNVKYEEFIIAMERFIYGLEFEDNISLDAYLIAQFIIEGYGQAMEIALSENLVRAFTIAPTTTCSFRYKDLKGFTCAPEISPPVADPSTKTVERISQRNGKTEPDLYQYPLNIELCGTDVTWELYDRLVKVFQVLMDDTGLAHTISYNWWLSKPVNLETFKDWYDSPLKTIYYRWEESSDKTSKIEIQIESSEDDMDFWSGENEDIWEVDYDHSTIKTEIEQSISAVSEDQWFWGEDDTVEITASECEFEPIRARVTQNNDQNKCMTCS